MKYREEDPNIRNVTEEMSKELARLLTDFGLEGCRVFCVSVMRPDALSVQFKPVTPEQARKILAAVREVAPEVIR